MAVVNPAENLDKIGKSGNVDHVKGTEAVARVSDLGAKTALDSLYDDRCSLSTTYARSRQAVTAGSPVQLVQ